MAETVKGRYDRLAPRREPFLRRGRGYAALTIPSLLPPLGHRYTADLPEPYQGFGARAVTNLSSKLADAILPAGMSSFRLTVPNAALLKTGTMSPPKDVEQGLTLSEGLMNSEIERKGWRSPTNLSLQLLLVTGNALEQMMPDNTIRVFRLDQFVVQRDHAGNLIEVIIEEKLDPLALPERAQSLVASKDMSEGAEVALYTQCRRLPDGRYRCRQEVNGKNVPGSVGYYKDSLPFIPLRWALVPGEDYGRGKVEEHIGDLRALENYAKSMQDGAAMAARHITLVKPNAAGGNLRQRIAKANNGDVLSGNAADVEMLQFQNLTGLQIVSSEIQRVVKDLAAAWLLMSDLRRDAERVTVTELRQLAEELESALGGVYSLLAQEMQQTRIRRLIVQMQANRQLPRWRGDMVDTKVTTGLEALSREQDVVRVTQAAQVVQPLATADPSILDYIKGGDMLAVAFNGLRLPNMIRTDTEVADYRKQKALTEAIAQGVGQGTGAALSEAAKQPQGAKA